MSRESQQMLIGELAQQTGVTPDTIRFYEKRGLLDRRHMVRKDNNYKDYGSEALQRLQLISQSKCAGFTLSEIMQWLQEWDTLNPAERREVLLNKVGQIESRILELEKMKAYLSASMDACLAGCNL
jgi:MerR family transcriptional regulator, copper efflux regulator